MNRAQLEHAIRAACAVADDTELYVIGSQSILGQYPDAPEELRASIEVDVIPKNRPEAWGDIDGALGELSRFHETHGFYVQGVGFETATLPRGWKRRCYEVVANPRAKGYCLESHDLALSKLAAFREKDLEFVRTLLIDRLVTPEILLERLATLPVRPAGKKAAIERWIERTAREMGAR